MGSVSTVVDIAEQVKLVDAEMLDDVGDGSDKHFRLPRRDDGFDDAVVVGLLVLLRWRFVEELLDYIREF